MIQPSHFSNPQQIYTHRTLSVLKIHHDYPPEVGGARRAWTRQRVLRRGFHLQGEVCEKSLDDQDKIVFPPGRPRRTSPARRSAGGRRSKSSSIEIINDSGR